MRPTEHLLEYAQALDVCSQALARGAGVLSEPEAAALLNRISPHCQSLALALVKHADGLTPRSAPTNPAAGSS